MRGEGEEGEEGRRGKVKREEGEEDVGTYDSPLAHKIIHQHLREFTMPKRHDRQALLRLPRIIPPSSPSLSPFSSYAFSQSS